MLVLDRSHITVGGIKCTHLFALTDVDATIRSDLGGDCQFGPLRQLHGDGRGVVRGRDQGHGRSRPGLQVSS